MPPVVVRCVSDTYEIVMHKEMSKRQSKPLKNFSVYSATGSATLDTLLTVILNWNS